MTALLFVAAGPGLLSCLADPLEALGVEVLEIGALDPSKPGAALLDGDFCDAPAVARRLRQAGFAETIVAIGADAPDANAVLTRPLRLVDLLACLKAAPARGNGVDARLTEKETAILRRLTQARGAILSREALLADVWGYGPNVSTRTLETHIHRLRRKIELDPKRPQRLLTDGSGYRLANVGEIETI